MRKIVTYLALTLCMNALGTKHVGVTNSAECRIVAREDAQDSMGRQIKLDNLVTEIKIKQRAGTKKRGERQS
jgi:hypothetical protein